MRHRAIQGMVLLAALLVVGPTHAQTNTLPSWNDGPAKQAIIEFVRVTTDKASPKFVPAEARIATFDNDGTLWAEQPLYLQFVFALDRVKGAGSTASRMEDEGAVCNAAPRRSQGRARRR